MPAPAGTFVANPYDQGVTVNLGYVGLGNMGGALAARLAIGGDLHVFDLDPAAIQAQVTLGATAASDLTTIGRHCDVVFLCLPTSAHVREVLLGAGGLAQGLRPGALVIDQTSGDPRETARIAEELSARGIDLVDAPVSGGPVRAAEGTIAIMVGGSGALFDRAHALLQRISPNVYHAGELGSGHAIKLVNNLVSGVIRLATLEGVALAAKLGVSPENAVKIMSAGGARNDWMVAVMGPQILNGNLANGFSVGLAHKDLKIACELADEASVPLPVGGLTREIYRMCINEWGFNTRVDALALMIDRMAGTDVVPKGYRFD